MRICSLLPGVTEVLYQLGVQDEIVAVSNDCDYPAEVRQKPVVSKSKLSGKHYTSKEIHSLVENHKHTGFSIYDIDEGYLKEAKPDLIFTQELCEVCAVPYSQVLKAAKVLDNGPKIVSLEPKTIKDVLENILLIGKLVGRRKESERVVSKLRSRISFVSSKAKDAVERPRVLNLEWTNPPMAGGHWIPEMIEIAGGVDGIAKAGKGTVKLDWEKVVAYRPEVVVVTPCNYTLEESLAEVQTLKEVPQWLTLPAVQKGKVYAANSKWYFSRSGPRLVTGLEIMAEVIHPEIFDNLAPRDSFARAS